MPHRTFLAFILPSLVVMILFIALPIVSIAIQSLYVQHERVLVEVETCDPFGCRSETRVDVAVLRRLQVEQPLGRFNGLGTYANANHLATAEIAQRWRDSPSWGAFLRAVWNLPFYRALGFTISYTAVVTPLAILLGFMIALAVNAMPRGLRGGVIYFTLLPMIVPSLIGALVLFWMIDARGVIGATLAQVSGNPDLSLKASPVLTWITIFIYGIWSAAPFTFLIYYAGLQTVPKDTLESAMIDGATRLDRIRYVVLPHLAPLTTFLVLILIMGNFRVFEAIIGFSAQASATSLSLLVFEHLRAGDVPLFGSAGATSMLTIAFIAVLLLPSMRRSWRSFKMKG